MKTWICVIALMISAQAATASTGRPRPEPANVGKDLSECPIRKAAAVGMFDSTAAVKKVAKAEPEVQTRHYKGKK